MRFHETPLRGAYIIDLEFHHDERGSFVRTFCADEFEAQGLETAVVQCNASFNRRRGTLRGLHFQVAPYEEAKLVRCTKGSIYDVIVDLRPDSPTYAEWFGAELNEEEGRSLFIPRGFAHGFQTLADDTVVFYQMSEFYHPQSAGGIRWDDPVLGIAWPVEDAVLSEKDRTFPLLADL